MEKIYVIAQMEEDWGGEKILFTMIGVCFELGFFLNKEEAEIVASKMQKEQNGYEDYDYSYKVIEIKKGSV